jgi:hypothetical protein
LQESTNHDATEADRCASTSVQIVTANVTASAAAALSGMTFFVSAQRLAANSSLSGVLALMYV